MKVHRLLGSLVVAGTLSASILGLMGPAEASTDLSLSVNPVNNSQIPGSLPANAVPIQVTASCDTLLCSISSISASLTGPSGAAASLASGSMAKCPSNPTVGSCSQESFTWNTQPASSPNGKYSLNASATDSGISGGTQPFTETLLLNNAPSAPTGVSAALNPAAGNTPLVSWKANPEPDISGYEVFRSGSGSSAAAFSAPANVTSYQDTTAPQGAAVSYIVVAVRTSPVWGSGITSCGGQAPCSNPPTSQETPAVTVPAAATATTQQLPKSVATVDPPKSVSGSGTTGTSVSTEAPITLGGNQLKPIVAPSLPTTIVQLPEPNVVQFAPLLPYSGKIPEVAVTSSVPAPVQAADGGTTSTESTVALPVLGHVKTVDAVKYIAAAIVLIVGAVHLTRYARGLTKANSSSSGDS
ncbi:MAG: hypothetical protein ACRDJU_08800 [Actinomycetota bacterium]